MAPTTPGSIHDGGELGYSLSHAFGAVFDNPGLIVACIVGDGEAETGPLATAWHSNKMLNTVTDGAVLPILHLNGNKISNPTILARIAHEELEQFYRGCGWVPYFVEGDDPATMHQLMAAAMEKAIEEIHCIKTNAHDNNDNTRPRWPMIILSSPKGWTGPKEADAVPNEGTFHAHQVLVHRLTYSRTNRNLHVRGYKEEGTITTPFDLRVQNDIDRFHLVIDVIDRLPRLGSKGTYLKQQPKDKLIAHKHYVYEQGKDMPGILNWKWKTTNE